MPAFASGPSLAKLVRLGTADIGGTPDEERPTKQKRSARRATINVASGVDLAKAQRQLPSLNSPADKDILSSAMAKRQIYSEARRKLQTLRTIPVDGDLSGAEDKQEEPELQRIGSSGTGGREVDGADGSKEQPKLWRLSLKTTADSIHGAVKQSHAARRSIFALSTAAEDGLSQEDRLRDREAVELLLQKLEAAAMEPCQAGEEITAMQEMELELTKVLEHIDPSNFSDSVQELHSMLKHLQDLRRTTFETPGTHDSAILKMAEALEEIRSGILIGSQTFRTGKGRDLVRRVINASRFGRTLSSPEEDLEGLEGGFHRGSSFPEEGPSLPAQTAPMASRDQVCVNLRSSRTRRAAPVAHLAWEERAVTARGPAPASSTAVAYKSFAFTPRNSIRDDAGFAIAGENRWGHTLKKKPVPALFEKAEAHPMTEFAPSPAIAWQGDGNADTCAQQAVRKPGRPAAIVQPDFSKWTQIAGWGLNN